MMALITLAVILNILFIFSVSTEDDEEVVQDEDKVFEIRPRSFLVQLGNGAVEFECSLKEHGIIIWYYGPEADVQQIAKGGEIKIERVKSLLNLVVLDTGAEKLKIDEVTKAYSGLYHCRDAIKRVRVNAKLYVFEKPKCRKEGNDLVCEVTHSDSVKASAELKSEDRIISHGKATISEANTNILGKSIILGKDTFRWIDADKTDYELKINIWSDDVDDKYEFTSTKVTKASLNISSGYTLLVNETVQCTSTAGFLSTFRITVTQATGTFLETTNDTFRISSIGTFNITCRAEGVLGGSESDSAIDVKVNSTFKVVPCELMGAVNCFNSYTSLFDGETELSRSEVQSLCDLDRSDKCLNYLKPCIMTRKIRGLQESLEFLCSNLEDEHMDAMFINSHKPECLKYNFHIFPLKDIYLNMMHTPKIPVTPIDVIYERAAKYVQDALKEACIRSHIAMSVNGTEAEWIYMFREVYFDNELRMFSEYIDDKNKIVDTSKCNFSSTAGSKNIACVTARKCIKILVGMAELVHYGVVIVSNLTQFASDTCDGSLSQLQECSYKLKDYYDDQSVYLAVNHLVILFDGICERYWMSYVKHSECLLSNLGNQTFLVLDDCVNELRSDLSQFPVLNETFLDYENQTSLCLRVHDFLGCQEKILSKMCGPEFASLQRKFSRRGISTDMINMYCYNTFSY